MSRYNPRNDPYGNGSHRSNDRYGGREYDAYDQPRSRGRGPPSENDYYEDSPHSRRFSHTACPPCYSGPRGHDAYSNPRSGRYDELDEYLDRGTGRCHQDFDDDPLTRPGRNSHGSSYGRPCMTRDSSPDDLPPRISYGRHGGSFEVYPGGRDVVLEPGERRSTAPLSRQDAELIERTKGDLPRRELLQIAIRAEADAASRYEVDPDDFDGFVKTNLGWFVVWRK
ncbi:hypothetical protein BU25DRAFT_456249 [Macroventuria anomochaeta]|uniref:Uncharacterized protein n=1 Tax=Macroventuria anomochaeta TaxID=301207 RepID=A0ACB6S8I6_9PLEO|nr:uncharacterized protein BU25DRAFT_456249 [Macroventuria anomochaeta]KAF2630526.1 hypothetical protein BU25DRAFT_456249 [Macroventuria anomochaeta]